MRCCPPDPAGRAPSPDSTGEPQGGVWKGTRQTCEGAWRWGVSTGSWGACGGLGRGLVPRDVSRQTSALGDFRHASTLLRCEDSGSETQTGPYPVALRRRVLTRPGLANVGAVRVTSCSQLARMLRGSATGSTLGFSVHGLSFWVQGFGSRVEVPPVPGRLHT